MTKTLRPKKKISVFRVKGLKIFGRVFTHFLIFFLEKNKFMHLERHLAFQNAYFFSEYLKILDFKYRFYKSQWTLF